MGDSRERQYGCGEDVGILIHAYHKLAFGNVFLVEAHRDVFVPHWVQVVDEPSGFDGDIFGCKDTKGISCFCENVRIYRGREGNLLLMEAPFRPVALTT